MVHKFYNPETKIWSTPPHKSVYNPEAGVGDIVLYGLRSLPTKVAQICADDDSKVTFQELAEQSITVAENLTKRGYGAGDMIAIAGRNNKDIAAVFFGCTFIGATINTLDPTFGKGKTRYLRSPTILKTSS